MRVLIADDHPNSRSGLRALLATLSDVMVIGEAANGREALRLTEEARPDVILMDVQMPVMDGLEATREVKTRWPGIRVVMLTVYAAHRKEAMAAGADEFLIKGCPVEQMWAALLNTKGQRPYK